MDGGLGIEFVPHPQRDRVAFTPAQQRAGNAAVDGHGRARVAGDVDWRFADEQLEVATGQDIRPTGVGDRPHGRAPQPEATKHCAGGESLYKRPS
ncbi:hypothetical protein D9M71_831590 [compost metagenome]